jgi:hypothetical protein
VQVSREPGIAFPPEHDVEVHRAAVDLTRAGQLEGLRVLRDDIRTGIGGGPVADGAGADQ